MALLNFNYGLVKDLPQNIINGNLYITTDSQGLYVDLEDTRIHVSDFIQVESVDALNALGTYSTQVFYYVTNSNALMKYTGDVASPWKQLNSTADLVSRIQSLENDITSLEGNITSLETADANLDSRIDNLEAVIGGVQGAMHFVGISTVDPAFGTVSIEGKEDYSPANGDVVIYKEKETDEDGETIVTATIEYVYSDGDWVELGDVSAEAKRIGALEDRMTVAETATAKIPDIESNINSLNTAKTNLESRVSTLEANDITHASAIQSLEGRMGAAEADITKNASDIRAELAAKVQELQNAINAEAATRNSADTNLQGQIDTINGHLTWVKLPSV